MLPCWMVFVWIRKVRMRFCRISYLESTVFTFVHKRQWWKRIQTAQLQYEIVSFFVLPPITISLSSWAPEEFVPSALRNQLDRQSDVLARRRFATEDGQWWIVRSYYTLWDTIVYDSWEIKSNVVKYQCYLILHDQNCITFLQKIMLMFNFHQGIEASNYW